MTWIASLISAGVAASSSVWAAAIGVVGLIVVAVTLVKTVLGGKETTVDGEEVGETWLVVVLGRVVGDGVTELVDGIGNSDDVVVDVEDDSEGGDGISVLVVVSTVELVKGGGLVVDVVVVGAALVVVVLDDVGKLVEDCSVVGVALLVVVCHVSTVVDGSGSVVEAVVFVVVGTTGSVLNAMSYCTPSHHASGLPQHTPARTRHQPACTSTAR